MCVCFWSPSNPAWTVDAAASCLLPANGRAGRLAGGQSESRKEPSHVSSMWGGREGTGREPRPTAACRAGSFPAFLKLPETEAVDVLGAGGGVGGRGEWGIKVDAVQRQFHTTLYLGQRGEKNKKK